MVHRSGPNLTDSSRRALFAIYNAARDGDYHDLYYQRESEGRRKAGSTDIGGKANMFFTGKPARL